MRPVEEWWQAIRNGTLEGQEGLYIDAVRDPASLAGDATIGLEILAQSPAVEAVLIPFGGGGLACGIACAVRALRPDVKIIALLRADECASAEGSVRSPAPPPGYPAFAGLRQRRGIRHGASGKMWPLV